MPITITESKLEQFFPKNEIKSSLKLKIQIDFVEKLLPEKVVDIINTLQNPQIILWLLRAP